MFNSGPFIRSSDKQKMRLSRCSSSSVMRNDSLTDAPLTLLHFVYGHVTIYKNWAVNTMKRHRNSTRRDERGFSFLATDVGDRNLQRTGGNGVRAIPALFDHRSTSRKNLKVAKNKTQRLKNCRMKENMGIKGTWVRREDWWCSGVFLLKPLIPSLPSFFILSLIFYRCSP